MAASELMDRRLKRSSSALVRAYLKSGLMLRGLSTAQALTTLAAAPFGSGRRQVERRQDGSPLPHGREAFRRRNWRNRSPKPSIR
jgi:hypothetical protein